VSSADLLAEFYSAPNEVDPGQLDGDAGDMLATLTARVTSGTRRSLLPARRGGVTSWYGIAPTDREARLLREEVRCWLGPPVSTRAVDLHGSDDSLDRVASRLAGSGAAIRIDIAANWQPVARTNVASLIDLWHLAPERGVDQPRPVGRVLRQFYEGLLAGDRSVSESSLEELRSRSLLSSTNVRFLRVELLSALGSPEELRDDPSLRGISLLARPPAVTERLAEAANALVVEPALVHGRVDAPGLARAVDEFWPALVTHPRQVTTLATARCFALYEMASDTPNVAALDALRQTYASDELIEAVTPAPATSSGDAGADTRSPQDLYHEGDFWAALDAVEGAGIGRAGASIALAAAMNIGDSASAVRALSIVETLPEDDRDALLATSVERAFYDTLSSRTSASRAPTSWLDWLRGAWIDRPDLLSEWARQWQRTPEILERDSAQLAGELLDALNDDRRGRVRNGVPVFVDWLVSDGLPASAVGLAVTVVDVLLGSDPGRLERQAALVVLEETLAAGASRDEYRELIDAVQGQLGLLGPRDAAWLAQCLGLFLLFGAPDGARRSALLADSLGAATSWASRTEAADLTVLQLLFEEAGLNLALPASREAATDVPQARSFGSVGIYSLLESAARVAAGWIRKLFPNVNVRLSSEHVNSASLVGFARGSDVLLVQTSHAKHAATQAIEAAADPARVVLVHGRGASALVRALLAWSQDELG
jgi:hypothetical protein